MGNNIGDNQKIQLTFNAMIYIENKNRDNNDTKRTFIDTNRQLRSRTEEDSYGDENSLSNIGASTESNYFTNEDDYDSSDRNECESSQESTIDESLEFTTTQSGNFKVNESRKKIIIRQLEPLPGAPCIICKIKPKLFHHKDHKVMTYITDENNNLWFNYYNNPVCFKSYFNNCSKIIRWRTYRNRAYLGKTYDECTEDLIKTKIDKKLVLRKYKPNEYYPITVLGAGRFSTVLMVMDHETKHFYALKLQYGIRRSDDEEHKQIVKNEIKHLINLSHPNIVRIFEYFKYKNGDLYILFEPLLHGTLATFIYECFPKMALRNPPNMRFNNYNFFRYTCIQILMALDYMHKVHVAHCDLNLDNVMFDYRGYIKLIDFGWSQTFSDDPEYPSRYPVTRKTPNIQDTYNNQFLSDEMVEGAIFDGSTDIYSFGMVYGEMLDHLLTKDEIGYDLDIPIISFYEHCVNDDRSKRPTAEELLTVDFLNYHIDLNQIFTQSIDLEQELNLSMADVFVTAQGGDNNEFDEVNAKLRERYLHHGILKDIHKIIENTEPESIDNSTLSKLISSLNTTASEDSITMLRSFGDEVCLACLQRPNFATHIPDPNDKSKFSIHLFSKKYVTRLYYFNSEECFKAYFERQQSNKLVSWGPYSKDVFLNKSYEECTQDLVNSITDKQGILEKYTPDRYFPVNIWGFNQLGISVLVLDVYEKQLYTLVLKYNVKKLAEQDDPQAKNIFKNEIKNLNKLSHPNIIRMIRCFEHQDDVYILYEPLPYGSLSHFYNECLPLIKLHPNEEKQLHFVDFVRYCCVQILMALNYMHKCSVAYGGLRSENVMFDYRGYIKLVDFSLSETNFNELDESQVISNEWYDIHQFGKLLKEMCRKCFVEIEVEYDSNDNREYEEIKNEVESIISDCTASVDDYCTANELLNRPFFSRNIDKAALFRQEINLEKVLNFDLSLLYKENQRKAIVNFGRFKDELRDIYMSQKLHKAIWYLYDNKQLKLQFN